MKNFLFLLVAFVLLASAVQAQAVYKYRTSHKSERTGAGSWSDDVPINVLVVVNTRNQSITMFGNKVLRYDILATETENSANREEKVLLMRCVDTDGDPMVTKLRQLGSGQMQLYVYYSGFAYCYEITLVSSDEE